MNMDPNSPLTLAAFVKAINKASFTAMKPLINFYPWFGRSAVEEGVTDDFAFRLAGVLQDIHGTSPHGDPLGQVISKTDGPQTLQTAGGLVRSIMIEMGNAPGWYMSFPTRHAERYLGWDFGCLATVRHVKSQNLNEGAPVQLAVFVQAKTVTFTNSGVAEINFKYFPEGSKRSQMDIFGDWLKHVHGILEGQVRVIGLYALYGHKGCPIGWITWKKLQEFRQVSDTDEYMAKSAVPAMCEFRESMLDYVNYQ